MEPFKMTIKRASLMEKMKECYSDLKWVWYEDEWVLCGLMRMAFTTGLFYGLNEVTYLGRWCFHTWREAYSILSQMSSIPDDLMIEGNWIKHKGGIELRNPNYEPE